MKQRRAVAGGILLLWVGGLGMLAKRELTPNEGKRRAEMVMLVEPRSYYYAVELAGKHVGYASSQIDTSVFGLRLRDILVTQRMAGEDSSRASHQFSAQLTPQLRVRDFDARTGRAPHRREVAGRAIGDSAIEIRYGRRLPTDSVPYTRFAVTPEIAPLLLALGRTLKVGESHEVELFDRGNNTVARAPIRIDAESLFVVPDSAATDSASGLWVVAHSDTVRAWRATIPTEGGGTIWFDRGGRIVNRELGGGLTMRRTAFEMAFENWRAIRGDMTDTADVPVPLRPAPTLRGSGGP